MNKFFCFLLLFCAAGILAYAQDEVTVTGNELMGRVENGLSVREVNGNVVLRQGNVVITCNRAIQFLAANNAHLIGNVVVTQDTLTIKTPEAWYYGNERRALSDKGVRLEDKKVVLTAVNGEYFFKLNKADFRDNVVLRDSASTLYSGRLLYFRRENKSIATNDVKIIDKQNIIRADSLEHFRVEQLTDGYGNIAITNRNDGVTIYGDHVTDYRKRLYSIIDKNPLLIKIDSSKSAKPDTVVSLSADSGKATPKDSIVVDTLIIRCGIMEAFRDSSDRFLARDSVRIIKGEFQSKNDFTIFQRLKERIITHVTSDSAAAQPAVWYGLTQLTGDSITVQLNEKKIDKLYVTKNSLIISPNEKFTDRFDQVAGDRVVLHFADNKMYKTEVFKNVLSIYFMYDNGAPNGLLKASGQDAMVTFADGKVDEVHLYSEPKSEFHPEDLIAGKLKQYILPRFYLVPGKPVKDLIFKSYKNSRFTPAIRVEREEIRENTK